MCCICSAALFLITPAALKLHEYYGDEGVDRRKLAAILAKEKLSPS
jgi:hypothetical protein